MGARLIRYAMPLVLVLAVGGGVANASTTARAVTVKAATTTGYGNLLVSSTGLSLYHLRAEKPGSIVCTGACAKLWPPLLLGTSAKPLAGTGVHGSKLGTIKRPDGNMQVTYNGLALYRYQLDKKPGDVKGQGVEGVWFAITAAGTLAKTSAPASGTATTPSSAPSTTTTGGDTGYSSY